MDVQLQTGLIENRLLAALSAEDLELITPHLTPVQMVRNDPVFDPGEPARQVLFPVKGVVSVVALDINGEAVEAATIGREGMTGVAIVLGSDTQAHEAMVQVAGRAFAIETVAFRKILDASPTLRRLMLRYILAVLTQITQNAACNQLHAISMRCARWLLTTHDRVSGDAFMLTQEYLAMMLGVTRPSVSAAAAGLQAASLIRYRRGLITVLDRPGLEAASCECYRIIEAEFDRLLRPD